MSNKSDAMKVCYFAWVRERVGKAEEIVEPPATVKTVKDLLEWLRSQGPEYEAAFNKPEIIRAALDRTHVKSDTAIAGAREIAFFPPVTGG